MSAYTPEEVWTLLADPLVQVPGVDCPPDTPGPKSLACSDQSRPVLACRRSTETARCGGAQHIQLPFNLLDRRWKTAEFAAAAAARPDVTIHTRSTFLQGVLVSGIDRWPPFTHELVQCSSPQSPVGPPAAPTHPMIISMNGRAGGAASAVKRRRRRRQIWRLAP